MSSRSQAVFERIACRPFTSTRHAAFSGSRARQQLRASCVFAPAYSEVWGPVDRPLMAATGPGGGVLDRPAVLPGYDNK